MAYMSDNSEYAGFASEDEPDAERDAALTAIRNDYRWTPSCQRAFLEELACSGSITRATLYVEKSARSAYALRFRREGAAFRLGWDAAILLARATLSDTLMDRAINYIEENSERGPDRTLIRRRVDNRLGQGLLARLDRMAEAQPQVGSALAQIQLVSQDFECFLDLIGNGGHGAEAALFVAARSVAVPGSAEARFDCELAQFSADLEAEEEANADGEAEGEEPHDMFDMPIDKALAQMTVWFDDKGELKTNFPPRNAEDSALVTQNCLFGELDYERTLTPAEEDAYLSQLVIKQEPLRAAALAAREACFGAGFGAKLPV